MPPEAIALPLDAIAQLCQRWKVQEFYLFSSVLRDDFRLDSDVQQDQKRKAQDNLEALLDEGIYSAS